MSFVLPTAVDSIAATTMYLAIFAILLISFHGSRMLLIFIARIIYFFVARYASSCMINQFSDIYVRAISISLSYFFLCRSKFYSQRKTYK